MEPSENNSKEQKPTPNPNNLLDPRSSSNPTGGSDPAASQSPSHMALNNMDPKWWDFMEEEDDNTLSLTNIPQLTPSEIINTTLPPFPLSDSSDSFHFILPDFISSDIPSTSQIPLLPFPIPNDSFINPVIERGDLSPTQLQVDQLIRAAEAVEANNITLAQVILARLNQELSGNPLQRATFYFKEALESLLLGIIGNRSFSNMGNTNIGTTRNYLNSLSSSETVHKIKAYKDFYDILPISQFANFTSNQAIIEAVDGFTLVHVIDFDIGIGDQWSSFMLEISTSCKAARSRLPSLRITAIVAKESMETNLVVENLRNFARDIGMRFQIDFMSVAIFATLAFGAIWIADGEAIVVNFSPSIFRQLEGVGMAATRSVSQFLRYLTQLSPRITVFVDMECQWVGTSFHRNIAVGLEYYSSLIEALDAMASDAVAVEKIYGIEKFLLRPRILQWVVEALKRPFPWRELISNAGMLLIPFSEVTERHLECLVRRTPFQGFHVAKQHGSMMLCWQGRELIATSAWRCP
ncbi:scarecrow-like protein 15 [Tasmannia lanceolata]|uniref:scarecrow-like protein 15 n=1 Tax=Tasmannia lanceolata TaxID=3420 RepID=UPI004062FD8D